MTKESLYEYRKFLSTLTDEQLKERNVYLKKLAKGEILGPSTGYASLDNRGVKFYSDEQLMTEFNPKSIYQLMHDINANHGKDIAINYFNNKVSFEKMEKNIDEVAKGLINKGIKPGEKVLMCLPNVPEAEYLFYALNKIGATVVVCDPRTNKEHIISDIKEFNIKNVFAVDVVDPVFEDISKECDIDVVSVSPFESLPVVIKALAKAKSHSKTKFESWNEFVKKGDKAEKVTPTFKENEVAVIVHTGGSTGTPKGVKLTNEEFNGLIYQLINNNMKFRRGQKFLNILPPFIALGLDNAMHLAACCGIESIMIPSFEPEDIPKLIKKYKPNVFMGGPIHFNIMINSNELKNEDMSYLEICCSGGDKMKREHQTSIQEFLENHNSSAKIWLGYGATECSSGISCMTDDCFRYEGVGVPYLNNVIKIVDEELNEVCGYNTTGELLIKAPTMMEGYTGANSAETSKVIINDDFGQKWYRTGDLAHIDEDGILYIDGRIKRIITRRGFKIYPQFIEELVLKNKMVKECVIVGVEDPDEMNIPVANIVLNDNIEVNEENKEEVINYINKLIGENFPEYTVIAGFNFLDSIPLTPIGKTDFKKLEKIGIISEEGKIMQKKFGK